MRKNPCYNCVERIFGCHAGCERYIEWKTEFDEKKKVEKANREKEYQMNSYAVDKGHRMVTGKMAKVGKPKGGKK